MKRQITADSEGFPPRKQTTRPYTRSYILLPICPEYILFGQGHIHVLPYLAYW